MSSLFGTLSVAVSGLRASQEELDVTSNNVANANTTGYFDGTSKKKVIQHFYNNLLAHGYLFLGHSESLYGIHEDFSLIHLPSATAYVKSEKRRTL